MHGRPLVANSGRYSFAIQDATLKTRDNTSTIKHMDGKQSTISFENNFKSECRGECTGEILPHALAQEAIMNEIRYVNETVWEIGATDMLRDRPNSKLIGSRWVLCNKGDVDSPKIRARWVATEVNTGNDISFYAATPPLEAKRLLFSKYAHDRRRRGPRLQISLCDITKAYFNAKPSRDLFVRIPKEMGLPSNHIGHLLRCCYGTRDAGCFWEDTYAQALIAMGFKQGNSSPCVFHHSARNITIVVHGDGFSAGGLANDLDWYENLLSTYFEIGDKHRLSDAPDTEKEARILNRILKVSETHVSYEADPRHVELLAKSLNLTTCRPIGTTGEKHRASTDEAIEEEEEEEQPNQQPNDDGENDSTLSISSLMPTSHPRPKIKKLDGHNIHIKQTVQFDMSPAIVTIDVPYRENYGHHPSRIVFTGLRGDPSFQFCRPGDNPFTGRLDDDTNQTYRLRKTPRSRSEILAYVLAEGASWEDSNAICFDNFVCAVNKNFKKKRPGRNAVVSHEQLERIGNILTEDQKTTFRALAARTKYSSLDRSGCALAAKELCREYQSPTDKSFIRLKHLVRYLVHAPRVVYMYAIEDPVVQAQIHVDTDFAGCAITRRSTSGGTIMWGTHLIKHGGSTQSVIALSSGDAELSGITTGASHALGCQSLARDMVLDLSLHILSDAAAAIGICKRRGLGRIRHLHVADLWAQGRLKSGDFILSKIAGSGNPADLLTKYVDNQTLKR